MNPINLYLYAKQAASGYISSNQDLNDCIAKIAGKECLSQVQIQRVVELTNHEVNDQLRKTANEKTYTFPLASVDGVLSKLQSTPPVTGVPHVKLASAILDFNRGTGEDSIEQRVNSIKAQSGESELMTKEASIRRDATLKKLAAAKTKAHARYITSLNKVAEEMRGLTQVVKSYILTDGGDFKTLQKYASALVPNWAGWNTVLPTIREELLKLGQPFTSQPMATQMNFTSDPARTNPIEGPKVDVVNGRTQLGHQLKRVHETITEATRQSDKMREIDNFKDVIEQHPMKFTDNKQYQSFIDGLYRVDGFASKDDAFSDELINKLGQEQSATEDESAEKPATKSEKARALLGLAAGEAGHRASKATLDSAGKYLVHNYTPAAHDPHGRLPQYMRGKV